MNIYVTRDIDGKAAVWLGDVAPRWMCRWYLPNKGTRQLAVSLGEIATFVSLCGPTSGECYRITLGRGERQEKHE